MIKILIIAICLLIVLDIILICAGLRKWNSIHNKKNRYIYKPHIAIYSYNFGNFRKELDGGIDNMTFYPEFHYFFYTNNDIKSDKWKVIKVGLEQRTKHMNANRVTTKYYKFKKLPTELQKYDYVLHVDSSIIKGLQGGMAKFTPQKINDLIEKNKNVAFFGRRHPMFKNIKDEALRAQINGTAGTEYIPELKKWLSTLKKFKQKFTHTELCIFLRKVNDNDVNRIFPKVFNKLMERELCRDQHVFPYVLQEENFPEEKFLIVDDWSHVVAVGDCNKNE